MKDHQPQTSGYFEPEACEIADFEALIGQTLDPATVPQASEIVANIPLYDMGHLAAKLGDPAAGQTLMAEWAQGLLSGAGVLVLKGAYAETDVLDQATQVYEQIIAEEKAGSGGGADHFAAAGSNDRIWNALQKLCEAAPELFLRYFANEAIAAVCEAWLGPNYQMTAQINLVHPGGAAQQAHRDYHLGFQSAEVSTAYPAHVHDLSPALTLQGAVAHCDMPVESGPTKLLPFSQQYRAGYAAWRRDDFRALFEARCVQVPLAKGDAVFFNPALFHAAGANTSADIHRMANLLQVSSAFGRAMESVDRDGMCRTLFPHAKRAHDTSDLSPAALKAAIAATAEGYSFPTNLDRDPPAGGLAPETQQAFFLRALKEDMEVSAFAAGLARMAENRTA
ncbi:phytanoyl-CoA dioxygenase family protein [Thalassorhabdomicrobium marinisediminis]|uniref:Phytanoyl-CoA dioxygenase n=1 Tax=Thalassorhabdomicrobium marinisediminis TaxID=2170577 RepID=A0A2T7FTP1_9RHOB|nr:phytanoyl-CoA dioxygenase family protein [Thalassorhabdomicrobium marinisediminis]PVA05531.1 phytanoyl-CoA dioxygenase [Thalassorhabdomicrobium marinisediminis]